MAQAGTKITTTTGPETIPATLIFGPTVLGNTLFGLGVACHVMVNQALSSTVKLLTPYLCRWRFWSLNNGPRLRI